jgi:hypothetical protein
VAQQVSKAGPSGLPERQPDHLLHRRLSGTARHADHAGSAAATGEASEVAEGPQRVGHREQLDAFDVEFAIGGNDGTRRAAAHGLRQEVRPVHPLAREGDEQSAAFDVTRVDRDRRIPARRVASGQAEGPTHFVALEGGAHARPPRNFATIAASSNGSFSPFTSW